MKIDDCLCGYQFNFKNFSKNFNVGLCQNCGVEKFVSKDGLIFNYNDENEKYNDEAYLNGSVIRWSHKQIVKTLDVVGKRILEIGCFTGFYLDYLYKLGAIVEGVDVNLKAIAHGKSIYPKSVKLESSLKSTSVEQYDIILSIDFLEHVEDPESLVVLLKSKLKEGGVLVIAGPLDKRFFHDKSDYPPHHLWRYTVDGLNALCNRNGLVLLDRKDEYNMALFFRNLVGKLLYGFNKKEFFGDAHVKISNHYYLRNFVERIYRVSEMVGNALFYLMRIRYGSSILIYEKQ